MFPVQQHRPSHPGGAAAGAVGGGPSCSSARTKCSQHVRVRRARRVRAVARTIARGGGRRTQTAAGRATAARGPGRQATSTRRCSRRLPRAAGTAHSATRRRRGAVAAARVEGVDTHANRAARAHARGARRRDKQLLTARAICRSATAASKPPNDVNVAAAAPPPRSARASRTAAAAWREHARCANACGALGKVDAVELTALAPLVDGAAHARRAAPWLMAVWGSRAHPGERENSLARRRVVEGERALGRAKRVLKFSSSYICAAVTGR
jgi:hypothetical protein